MKEPKERPQPARKKPGRRRKKNPAAAVILIAGVFLVLVALVVILTNVLGAGPEVHERETGNQTLRIAAVGDIHMDQALLESAKTQDGTYDFTDSFLTVAEAVSGADLTIGNLECSFAGTENQDKAGWAPDELAQTLAGLGFDMLQTANSYSILGGLEGLNRTMQTVGDAGMYCIGTSASEKDYKQNYGMQVWEVNGIRVVFVAFTKGLNNMSLPKGSHHAVNLLYEDYDTNYSQVAVEEIETVMRAAEKQKPDVTIALVHWGVENDTSHSETQLQIADLLIENGADVIIGSHSHMVGEMTQRTVTTADGEERTAFVAYDLGDFYTSSDKSAQQQSVVLQLEFAPDEKGEITLSRSSYTPVYCANKETTAGTTSYQVWDAALALQLYEQGYINRVSEEEYESISKAIDEIAESVQPKEEEETE